MQPHRPAIAVVTPSILTGLGLESILRRIIPMAEVEVYDRFERFAADRPDRFFHYFVASQTFVEHNAFYLARRHRGSCATSCGCTSTPTARAIPTGRPPHIRPRTRRIPPHDLPATRTAA